MLSNARTLRIEWGDCDPAGIVFYPRFFAMFDTSTTRLFERALGMKKFGFLEHYGVIGYPLVEARARFLVPVKYSDDVVIESMVKEFRRASFDMEHRLTKDGVSRRTQESDCRRRAENSKRRRVRHGGAVQALYLHAHSSGPGSRREPDGGSAPGYDGEVGRLATGRGRDGYQLTLSVLDVESELDGLSNGDAS